MKKSIYLLLIILFFITGCKQNKVIKTHGIAYLDKREKLIFINQSNKNDIIKVLGQPSTKGMTNNDLWIYIERTTERGKLLKLGKDQLVKNNVLVLEFDKYGILSKKNFYDMNSMKKIKFAKNKTKNDINKENFVYGFLSSIRQKMQQRRR